MNDYKINLSTDVFDNFFNKLTQYVLVQKDLDRLKVKYKKQFFTDEDVTLKAILYDKVYQLDNSKKIKLNITFNDEEFEYFFKKQDSSYIINLGNLNRGVYSFNIEVEGQDIKKSGNFIIESKNIEDLSLRANHLFLKSLANNFDGKLYYPNEIINLVEHINQNKQKSVYSYIEKRLAIVNINWILLILLSIIFLEMFLRRFNGLV